MILFFVCLNKAIFVFELLILIFIMFLNINKKILDYLCTNLFLCDIMLIVRGGIAFKKHKGVFTLDKIAVIELNTNFIKMQQIDYVMNKTFVVSNQLVMPINLVKDFYPDCFIKTAVAKEINDILAVFKTILDREGVTETICFATSILNDAKNANSFLNEILSSSTFKFEILNPEEELQYLYSAVINSFSKPKGVICNIGDYSTELLMYNRRNVLHTMVIPFGAINIGRKFSDIDSPDLKCDEIKKFFVEELKQADWFEEITEEYEFIGTGAVFRNLGVLSRRAKKYPLDIEHNYSVSNADFKKVYSVIKPVDSVKNSKIKGLSVSDSAIIGNGLAIADALFDVLKIENLAVSKTDRETGMLFKHIIPLTNEKPISDTLGYSLQAINEYYDRKPNNIAQIYDLSLLLFKQLKVLHKLGRPYIRILRIASSLYNCGMRVNYKDKEKSGFSIIENSDLFGVSHSEIILACFVCKLRDVDNFNLSEWVKYKDLVTDEDLIAVKKLAVILKIAESLDITQYGVIKDISCDILGDSVIMKTIVEGNPYLEIKHAMLAGPEFKKAFNKNLEVL